MTAADDQPTPSPIRPERAPDLPPLPRDTAARRRALKIRGW